MVFKLPRLQQRNRLVDQEGRPSLLFLRYFNSDFAETIERQETAQNALIVSLQQAQTAVQQAQTAANQAQAAADTATGDGQSLTDTGTIDPDGTWQAVASVTLTGVVAGTLTISGTGPIQTDSVQRLGKGRSTGSFRVVEVVLGVDSVRFTGTFDVLNYNDTEEIGLSASVVNNSSAAVSAFSEARSSTGSITYRLDVRQDSGSAISGLSAYLNARRTI